VGHFHLALRETKERIRDEEEKKIVDSQKIK
jgi:hypothetical protein